MSKKREAVHLTPRVLSCRPKSHTVSLVPYIEFLVSLYRGTPPIIASKPHW